MPSFLGAKKPKTLQGWRFVAKNSALDAPVTPSLAAASISLQASTGVTIPMRANFAIHVKRYSCSCRDATDTEFILLQAAPSTIYESPIGQLNGFATFSGEAFLGVGKPGGAGTPTGQTITNQSIGNTIIDDWIEFDDYLPTFNLVAGGFTIHTYFKVANTDGVTAHVLTIGGTLAYDLYERLELVP